MNGTFSPLRKVMRDSSWLVLSWKSSITMADMVRVKQCTDDLKLRSPLRITGMCSTLSLSFTVYALFSNCMLGTGRRNETPYSHGYEVFVCNRCQSENLLCPKPLFSENDVCNNNSFNLNVCPIAKLFSSLSPTIIAAPQLQLQSHSPWGRWGGAIHRNIVYNVGLACLWEW